MTFMSFFRELGATIRDDVKNKLKIPNLYPIPLHPIAKMIVFKNSQHTGLTVVLKIYPVKEFLNIEIQEKPACFQVQESSESSGNLL